MNWVTDLFYDELPLYLQSSTRAFFYNYDSYYYRDGIEERLARLGHDLFEHVAAINTKVCDCAPIDYRTLLFVVLKEVR